MPGQQRLQALLRLLGCSIPHHYSRPHLPLWWDRCRAASRPRDHWWDHLYQGVRGDLVKNQSNGPLEWIAKLGDRRFQQWWTSDVFLGSAFDEMMGWVNISCFLLDQLHYGVRLLAEKYATNYGDCEALISFIRDSIGDYHLQGKVSILHHTDQYYFTNYLSSAGQIQARQHTESPSVCGCFWSQDCHRLST